MARDLHGEPGIQMAAPSSRRTRACTGQHPSECEWKRGNQGAATTLALTGSGLLMEAIVFSHSQLEGGGRKQAMEALSLTLLSNCRRGVAAQSPSK
jgi:hypothetical protein